MSLMAAAGIYLILDVNTPLLAQHLNADKPWTTYYDKYLEHIFSVVEAFRAYPNTLALLSGNEVVQYKGSYKTSPAYIRAVTRDLKAYILRHSHRPIPVGYSGADGLDYTWDLPR